MTPQRTIKDSLYGQLARLTKSVAHPKRLELIDLLCQSPKSVEQLADQSGIGMTLASSHLKELRQAHIVDAQKQGRQVIYRLACPQTASLLVMLRSIAADCLLELQDALDKMNGSAEPWVQTHTFRRDEEWEMLEYVCAENDRHPVNAQGESEVQLND